MRQESQKYTIKSPLSFEVKSSYGKGGDVICSEYNNQLIASISRRLYNHIEFQSGLPSSLPLPVQCCLSDAVLFSLLFLRIWGAF